MSEKLILNIVTPEKLLVSEEVDQVNVPGSEGDMGILYDHTPILTNLRSGQLSYEKDGETIALVVSGGYLEVTDNRVTILESSCMRLTANGPSVPRPKRRNCWAKPTFLKKSSSKRRKNSSAPSPASKTPKTIELLSRNPAQ